MITIYGIKSCDTVRKAIKFLESQEQEFQFHDFRVNGLEQATLASWIKQLGWQKLLNTRSTSWRQLPAEDKLDVSELSANRLMIQNPTLIKRPVLAFNDQLLVGFKETEYQQLF